MNFAKKVLAAGCLFTMLAMPLVSYASPAQTSPRTGVPTVSVTASKYSNVAISKVSSYVNVRTQANTTSEIVGKIYNNCAATILATVDGEGGKWYQIQSGTVTGYIKAEYFITGSAAEKIAKEIGTVYVTINTTTLRLREKASTDSKTLTLLSRDAEYIAIGEEGDFVKIEVDASLSGYVHKDYIQETVEFDSAVSLLEEQQQKEEADRIKKEAEDAIAALNQLKTQ
ncbi:MAG: SH3 domain-containing protein, partial [Lachnospiraceae bacterium]|nr:SH3 domain-containing protein [Lachnospiraceae bacterium]